MGETLEILRCARCSLMWVRESEMIPGWCPACRLASGVQPDTIVVCAVDVKDAVVREYGLSSGLSNYRVRKGLDVLKLGLRCPHGYVCDSLCNGCQNKSANIIDTATVVG